METLSVNQGKEIKEWSACPDAHTVLKCWTRTSLDEPHRLHKIKKRKEINVLSSVSFSLTCVLGIIHFITKI